MRVELLATPECPHAQRAEEILRAALTEDGREPRVDRVYVGDLDDAAGLGFHGSPTIRIDGRDVLPPPPELPINLGCRLYPQPDGGLDGVVPADVIRAAADERREELAMAKAARPRLRDVPAKVSRALFLSASRRPALGRLATAVPVTRAMVRRFVAGDRLDDALDVLERLQAAGLRWTVDVLGESVSSVEAATIAADRYLATLDALAVRGLEANVSLKLTQMGLDIDADFCRANVGRVVDRARQIGAFVRIDMEDHTRTDATLQMVRSLHTEYGEVGAVIQSYLRRSGADVDQLIDEQIRVRLCKGAYDEPPTVAFATKGEVDANFARLAERLLLHGRYPALATHDEQLIGRAIDFARRSGIGAERFEFQMLYGVRRDLQQWLVGEGWTVRIYVPYGTQWYPYFMRRLGERPANVLFVLRSLLREGRASSDRLA
ncbi:MAG: proline dehydrogenase family protein [Chloroflexota bacterium]|nr:proline dehydrogenase family protein [Chloroflexota bacterium]